MARWMQAAGRLWSREEAATLVEYALVMFLVAAACVAAVQTFSSAVGGLFQRAVNGLPR